MVEKTNKPNEELTGNIKNIDIVNLLNGDILNKIKNILPTLENVLIKPTNNEGTGKTTSKEEIKNIDIVAAEEELKIEKELDEDYLDGAESTLDYEEYKTGDTINFNNCTFNDNK